MSLNAFFGRDQDYRLHTQAATFESVNATGPKLDQKVFVCWDVNIRVELVPSESLKCLDVVLVVDVLRATTTATALFMQGLQTLILADSLASARALNQDGDVLVGEDGGLNPAAFDIGNSPLEVLRQDFSGKTAILTTSNGTKAAHLAARSSEHVLLACLNNASAACGGALEAAHEEITILCAGSAGGASPDDTCAAGVLAARLLDSGGTPVGDGIQHALALYRQYPDPLPLLARTGAYLEPLGFGGDIDAAAQLDVTPRVPWLRGTRGVGLIFNEGFKRDPKSEGRL